MAKRIKKEHCFHYFAQAHILKVKLNKIGKKVKSGARNEVKQMSNRTMWKYSHLNDLTKDHKCKAMEILLFLSEKICNAMKGRA